MKKLKLEKKKITLKSFSLLIYCVVARLPVKVWVHKRWR